MSDKQEKPQQHTVEQQTLQVHMTYMQFSKKIAIAAIIAWIATILCAIAYIVFVPMDALAADLVKTITGYSATLTGTVIVAYMGNSGVEKYARYKYDFEAAKRDMGGANTFPITTTYRDTYQERYYDGPGMG